MSMLFMTEELKKELYPTYTTPSGEVKQDKTRLIPIKRTTPNFFFDLHKMPKGEEIGLLEPFQNSEDFYNEFRGIFIKPLICDYLAVRHALALAFEILMLGINLLSSLVTASNENIDESIVNIIAEAAYTIGYIVNSVVADVTTLPIFVLRAAATVVNAVLHLAAPGDTYQWWFNEVEASAPPALAHAVPLNDEHTESSCPLNQM